MNEQLRKAILDATKITSFRLSIAQAKISEENGNSVPWYPHDKVEKLVDANDKLLRVIEVLVEQRNQCRLNAEGYEGGWTFKEMDAELIAALEGK